MATDLLYKNRFFYATASQIRNTAVETAKLSTMYPYPPKDCNQALEMAKLLDLELTSALQSNDSNYKQALIAIKSQFDNYIAKAQCKEKGTAAEDQAFYDLLKQTQADANQGNAAKKTISTGIIIAVLGIILVGAGLIIMKRRKAAAA